MKENTRGENIERWGIKYTYTIKYTGTYTRDEMNYPGGGECRGEEEKKRNEII